MNLPDVVIHWLLARAHTDAGLRTRETPDIRSMPAGGARGQENLVAPCQSSRADEPPLTQEPRDGSIPAIQPPGCWSTPVRLAAHRRTAFGLLHLARVVGKFCDVLILTPRNCPIGAWTAVLIFLLEADVFL
jgi:hypothetical protein